MRLAHFESLQPVCPRCRVERNAAPRLRLAKISKRQGDRILEGLAHCSDSACQLEYPIIDGIPLFVPDVRQVISSQQGALLGREDLDPTTETLLHDALGPGSDYDTLRQHLSIYAWDAYAEFDPEEPATPMQPGAISRCLDAGLGLTGPLRGPVLDLGCSVGRSTFELASGLVDADAGALVLGVDLNFNMLKLARNILDQQTAVYPRRRVGIVYDQRRFPVPFVDDPQVDFWLCDVMALPFEPQSFGSVVALNLLDCVPAPHALLHAIGETLQVGGRAILSSPYDWSTAATPVEAWIGGHSQRAENAGSAEALVRQLLTPGAHPNSVPNLSIIAEQEQVPWQARLHDRSMMRYVLHLLALEATATQGTSER